MENFNLNQAITEIKDKYDGRLLGNPQALQAIINFEYQVVVPIKELEKLYMNVEDFELESRRVEYGN